MSDVSWLPMPIAQSIKAQAGEGLGTQVIVPAGVRRPRHPEIPQRATLGTRKGTLEIPSVLLGVEPGHPPLPMATHLWPLDALVSPPTK